MKPPATRVKVRVSPRATRSEVVGRHGEAWKLRIAAPPEAGRANEETLVLLADAVAVPRTHLSLIAGAGSRDKLVQVDGVAASEVERRLAESSVRKDSC